MPRRPRLDYPGAKHHVMNRSAGRTPFFTTDASCAMFMDVLADVPDRFGAFIHGYALMPNHYHLMVEVPRGNLSDVMRFVGATFTQAHNRARGTDGPIFRGRFHNRVVTTDAYWMHLLAYLALNPVKAGLAAHPDHAVWTHHLAYTGAVAAPDWLTTRPLTELFGSPAAIATYVQEVHIRRRGPPDGFAADALWAPTPSASVPVPPPIPRLSPEQALQQVADAFGVPVERVLVSTPGPTPNTTAWVAIWWLLQATDLSQREVGARVGLTRGRVSQIHLRAMKLSREDEGVRQIMEELSENLRP